MSATIFQSYLHSQFSGISILNRRLAVLRGHVQCMTSSTSRKAPYSTSSEFLHGCRGTALSMQFTSQAISSFESSRRAYNVAAADFQIPFPRGVEQCITDPSHKTDFIERFVEAYKLCASSEEKQQFLENWLNKVDQIPDDSKPALHPFPKNMSPRDARNISAMSEIVEQILKLKGGVRIALDIRRDILEIIAKSQNPVFRVIDVAFRIALARSFDPQDLKFSRLSMNSPAILFKKIIDNERVHLYRGEGWHDIQQRIGKGRRLFFFEHPRMVSNPLTFLHTAYTQEVTASMNDIFSPVDASIEKHANTAIFYSISSIEPGLKGIELGSSLIKRAVDYIQGESPHITQFFTLSPIPQFLPWLKKYLQTHGSRHFTEQEVELVKRIARSNPNSFQSTDRLQLDNVHIYLLKLVNNAMKGDQEFINQAEEILLPWKFTLMRLCAQYLTREKDSRGNAADPVANFHIRNGARVARLNWGGNINPSGLSQSFGIMTNYEYELDFLGERSEAYQDHGEVSYDSNISARSPAFWINPFNPEHASLLEQEVKKCL